MPADSFKAQLAREDHSGTVDTVEKKNKAGEIAAKVSGVKSVVNNIQVKP